VAKQRTKENIIDSIAVNYLSHLLKTKEEIVEKITDEYSDTLLVIQQASKRRLNKKKLLELHPKLSALLMVFKEGTQKNLSIKECEYLSEVFYKYFFCLKNIKNIPFDTDEPSEEGSKLCLILIVFFTEAIQKYCEGDPSAPSYKECEANYLNYIKRGFKASKIILNLDNSIEALTTIKEKYL
tara:strand:- start:3287 stop:3835 length:549 start_codon:yes stop_codon:yes gene_type:complete